MRLLVPSWSWTVLSLLVSLFIESANAAFTLAPLEGALVANAGPITVRYTRLATDPANIELAQLETLNTGETRKTTLISQEMRDNLAGVYRMVFSRGGRYQLQIEERGTGRVLAQTPRFLVAADPSQTSVFEEETGEIPVPSSTPVNTRPAPTSQANGSSFTSSSTTITSSSNTKTPAGPTSPSASSPSQPTLSSTSSSFFPSSSGAGTASGAFGPAPTSAEATSSERTPQVAMGVGLGIGIPLVLIILGAGLLYRRRKSRQHRDEENILGNQDHTRYQGQIVESQPVFLTSPINVPPNSFSGKNRRLFMGENDTSDGTSTSSGTLITGTGTSEGLTSSPPRESGEGQGEELGVLRAQVDLLTRTLQMNSQWNGAAENEGELPPRYPSGYPSGRS